LWLALSALYWQGILRNGRNVNYRYPFACPFLLHPKKNFRLNFLLNQNTKRSILQNKNRETPKIIGLSYFSLFKNIVIGKNQGDIKI
ncbi:MAG: hypothetical protein CMM75_11985, partial [Rhodospirillaceae bacterium]|nr:hypothetical protein [Rhodospirillaceae bacterium]